METSCAFYDTMNLLSLCRRPRSCHDCLETEGCVLRWNGRCENASDPDETSGRLNDYHKPRVANYANGSSSYIRSRGDFFAANATYCSTDDSICSRCRTEVFQGEDTGFCIGADGCVCTATCEVPAHKKAYDRDDQCGQDAVSVPRPVTPVQQTPLTIKRRDPRSPAVNFLGRAKSATCAAHAEVDLRGCVRPRTCQECLETEGCMVNRGSCDGVANFAASPTYRDKQLFNYSYHIDVYYNNGTMFPAGENGYCPVSDRKCIECRFLIAQSPSLGQYDEMASAGRYCVGANGCICIEACESEQWAANVRAPKCGGTHTMIDDPIDGLMATLAVATVVVVACG